LGIKDKLQDALCLRGNIPSLFLSSLIECTGWNMWSLVWQPFILSLGGSTSVIGGLNSLWGAIQSILQLGTGGLADSLGRKKLVNAYYVISIVGIGITLAARSWVYLIPSFVLFAVADALGEPAFTPLFAESVEETRRGTAFSLLSLTWFLPGFYSQLLAGFLGDRVGVRQVLYITLALEVLSLVVFAVFVKETLRERKPVQLSGIIRGIPGNLRPRGDLISFYAMSILDRFGWGLSGGIFVAMIYESFDFTLLQIGILTTATSVTSALTLMPIGRLVDRHGSRGALLASVALSATMFLGYMSTGSYVVFIALQVIKGLAIAFWDPAHNAYLSNVVEESERGRFFGSLNGLKGILCFPASLIGAYLYESFGFSGVFTASLVISLLTFVFALKIKE
jgi:DHA1 family multidrug resistance protein-like MFS transporter